MSDPLAGRRELLLATLALTVPMRIEELRDRSPEELAALAQSSGRTVAAYGDELQFTGRNTAAARKALTTGLAAAALGAWGGITFAGLHWCQTPRCTRVRDVNDDHPQPPTGPPPPPATPYDPSIPLSDYAYTKLRFPNTAQCRQPCTDEFCPRCVHPAAKKGDSQ